MFLSILSVTAEPLSQTQPADLDADCSQESSTAIYLLQEVLNLSWKASTKLLIHFGDAPAHGRQYHDGRVYDLYPAGDPNGMVFDSSSWLQ